MVDKRVNDNTPQVNASNEKNTPRRNAEYILHDILRLFLIFAIIMAGWWFIYKVIVNEAEFNIKINANQTVSTSGASQNTASNNSNIEMPGLSPAIQACYKYHTRTGPMIIAFSIGIALAIAYIFGTFLYKKFRDTSALERENFWIAISDNIRDSKRKNTQELIGEFREYDKVTLDRRNLYWSLFIRITLAILVVSLISLLISTCKIESQAGLPIISGIIAFIIGQGADFGHSVPSTVYVRAPTPVEDAGKRQQDLTETHNISDADKKPTVP